MQRPVSDAQAAFAPASLLKRLLRLLRNIILIVFAIIGIAATTILTLNWAAEANLTLADVKSFIEGIATFTQTHFVWAVTIAKTTLELIALVLIAFAAVVATM